MGILSFATTPAFAAVAVFSYVVYKWIRSKVVIEPSQIISPVVHSSISNTTTNDEASKLTNPPSSSSSFSTTTSSSFSTSTPDVIIVGAGILGCAMAATLAKDGRYVTVIERDMNEPDRIVGELLQPGGVQALQRLGLEDCLNNIDAITEKGYYVHYKGRSVHLPYPQQKDTGKFYIGKSFHHGRFIMNLREAAKQEKNVQFIEGTVNSLLTKDGDNNHVTGVVYKNKATGEELILNAPLTIVADGCFSKFRKELTTSEVQVPSHFVGMVLKNCTMFQENHAEVVLARPSPVLFYQISSTETRVLVDIKPPIPSSSNGDLKNYLVSFIAPQLPAHLKPSFLEACEKDRIRSMPNSFLPASPIKKKGVLLLGDAFNMRHPLTGGGMTVAFTDVCIWRDLLREVPDLSDFNKVTQQLVRFHWNRKSSHSFVVNVLAQALYALFSAADEHLEALREACFKYFLLGGECTNGPVSLLSITNPNPILLISHFFAVALYAMYSISQDIPLTKPYKLIEKSLLTLRAACVVIFPLIKSELKFVN